MKRVESRDGTQVVEIVLREDGLFSFHETSLLTEDGYTFWTPTYSSGLYHAADAAEREAEAILPWLQERIAR